MNKILNIGVIGTGGISNMHLSAYKKNPSVRLTALCDIDKKALDEKAEKYGVSDCYTDYREMIKKHPELDAVSVCTWNSVHADAAICALDAGINVLCEKPMALDAGEARKMLDAAEKSKARLMIGFVRRFGNDAEIVKDFISAGLLGELYYAKATYIRRNGCPGGWFSDSSRSGGGLKLDPELSFFSSAAEYPSVVTLPMSTQLSFDGLFDNEINHFVECLLSGAPFRLPAEDGVEMMKILDAVYESADRKTEIKL